MGRPMVPLDLTLSDIESQIQGHSDFEGLYGKIVELGHNMLILHKMKSWGVQLHPLI